MTTQNYNTKKAKNLTKLVQEYETECVSKNWQLHRDRKSKILTLELEGLIKLQDAVLEEDYEINQMNIEMLNHFRELHKKMVADYRVFDLAARAYSDAMPVVAQRTAREAQVVSKKQLREIVNVFNHQHR